MLLSSGTALVLSRLNLDFSMLTQLLLPLPCDSQAVVLWVPCILNSELPLRPQSGEEVDGLSVFSGSKADTKMVTLKLHYSEESSGFFQDL